MVGGRLMSAWGTGDLSYTQRGGAATGSSPPHEFGGMRVSPSDHFLAFDKAAKLANWQGLSCERSANGSKTNVAFANPVLQRCVDEIYGADSYEDIGQEAACDGFLQQQHTGM